MKKKLPILAFLAIVAVLLVVPAVAQANGYQVEANEIVWKTYVGEHWYTFVGDTYTFYNETTGVLSVRFQARTRPAWTPPRDWYFAETHLAIGYYRDGVYDTAHITGIPVTKNGSPIPGRFPFGDEWDPYVKTVTYDVNLGELGLPTTGPWVICAHAVVVDTISGWMDTGWATGCTDDHWAWPGGNWARYFDYPRTYGEE